MTRLPLALLDQLSPDGQVRLQHAGVLHRFARGATPILKGEAITGAYIVTHGRLRVAAMSAEGREATLYAIEPGETCVLAINALFKALPYPGNVVAEEDTEVLYVPGAVWRSLFATERVVQNMTLEALSVAVMRLMEALENVHAKPLRERLRNLLLERANGTGQVLPTQAEIAAELGTAREVVARHLAALRRAKLISGGRGRIEIRQA